MGRCTVLFQQNSRLFLIGCKISNLSVKFTLVSRVDYMHLWVYLKYLLCWKSQKTPPKTVKHFWVKSKYNLYCTSWLVSGHFISNTTFAAIMRQLLWHGCRAGGRKHFTQASKQALQSHCCDTARTMPLRLMCLSTSGKGISQKVISTNTTTITTSDGILSKLFGNRAVMIYDP